jgi:hypothetical protein
MNLEDQEEHGRSAVNLNYRCAKTMVSVCSIWASAIGKRYPNHYFMLCLHRIRVMMANFFVLYRISKRAVGHIDMEFSDDIGLGLQSEGHLCHLISVVQIFYHIKDIRKNINEDHQSSR